jgi:hypothetical protein
VTPCIPFQYVIDGCYARAHQMRRIITARYGYCCEKVFSFGTNGDTWRCKRTSGAGVVSRGGTTLRRSFACVYGSKDHPSWASRLADARHGNRPWDIRQTGAAQFVRLAAQENQGCASNAHVTSYSIQPGSAYWPSYGGGFDTDPNYTLTEQTLIAYSGLTTC